MEGGARPVTRGARRRAARPPPRARPGLAIVAECDKRVQGRQIRGAAGGELVGWARPDASAAAPPPARRPAPEPLRVALT